MSPARRAVAMTVVWLAMFGLSVTLIVSANHDGNLFEGIIGFAVILGLLSRLESVDRS